MKRAIVTYAAGAHEELLDVAQPTFIEFAKRHNYDLYVNRDRPLLSDLCPAWNKIPLMLSLVDRYEEVVWFDCDLVVVDPSEDFPPIGENKLHSLVRHFEAESEVPNTGVWRIMRGARPLLEKALEMETFYSHGWWEQAAVMTLMGYTVPPEGSNFYRTKCRNVAETKWFKCCQFMRLSLNSHPNYRAEHSRIVHCSYPDMQQRIEVMRALVKDPEFPYPRYDKPCEHCKKAKEMED